MICINCNSYYKTSSWNNTRFCNNCCLCDSSNLSEIAPTDEDVTDEITRLQEQRGTGRTKPLFYND